MSSNSCFTKKRIDLALIRETHFTQHLYIYILGYKLLKANHPDNTAHGGVAILIKSTIIFQSLPNYCYDHLQSCAVLIYLNSIPVTIAALYSPSKHKVLNADFHIYFSTFGNNCIVGGDYNAKHQSWGWRSNNPHGCALHTYASAKNLNVLVPPDPTYWPSSPRKNPDILDIFVKKIPSCLHSSAVNLLDLNSDHSSVLFTLNTIPLTRSEPPKLFNPSTDRLKFYNLVNLGIKLNVKLKSTNGIDLAINNFTNLIQSAAWSSNPHTNHPPNQTLVPSDIRIN